jgi:hypothetical protein
MAGAFNHRTDHMIEQSIDRKDSRVGHTTCYRYSVKRGRAQALSRHPIQLPELY